MRRTSTNRNAIANLCGYSSANALANFLRRYAKELARHVGDRERALLHPRTDGEQSVFLMRQD